MAVRLSIFRRHQWLQLLVLFIGLISVGALVGASPFGIAVHLPNETQLDLTADLPQEKACNGAPR